MTSAGGGKGSSILLLLLGAPIGFLGSLCGIGGGLFAGPLLYFFHGLELRRATGTALVLVVATTGASTATEAFQADPSFSLRVTAAVILGVLLGAGLGFRVSERIPDRPLQAVFSLVLFVAGARVLLQGAAPPEAALDASAQSLGQAGHAGIVAWDLVFGLLAGVGGGFVAPLLGVGGGLVMVPFLFLSIPGLGFDGARACSLAAGFFGALRSLYLKSGAGRVSWGHGAWLGAGAVLGASAGVTSLHAYGVLIEVGRVILGLVLWFAAGRFLVTWLRGGSGE